MTVALAITITLSVITLTLLSHPSPEVDRRPHLWKPEAREKTHIAVPMPFIVVRPKWILFGDSLTERSLGFGGWGSSIAQLYFRRIDVVNRGARSCFHVLHAAMQAHASPCGGTYHAGLGGYNTRWALHVTKDVFQGCDGNNTGLVTIFFGANDAARPEPEGNE